MIWEITCRICSLESPVVLEVFRQLHQRRRFLHRRLTLQVEKAVEAVWNLLGV